jgi:DNA-binding XRE family transcriptional regulator
MRVIEVVEGDGWPEIERFWIAYHRSRGYRLVNISDGGETNLGSPRTPEWKAAIGLANRGVKNAQAKLNEASVQQIKVLLLQKNLNNQEIAEQFGVSRRTISFINTGARWAHVKLPEDDSDNLWFL